MSSGDIDDTLGSQVEFDRLMVNYPRLAMYLSAVEESLYRDSRFLDWNFDFDIPFVAGISNDGRTVYVDRHYRTEVMLGGAWVDTAVSLAAHETTEWGLRQYAGIGRDYAHDPSGHRLANRAELNAVGILIGEAPTEDLWRRYSAFIDPQVKGIESDRIELVPRNLALYPYQGTSMLAKLERLMA